MGKQDNM